MKNSFGDGWLALERRDSNGRGIGNATFLLIWQNVLAILYFCVVGLVVAFHVFEAEQEVFDGQGGKGEGNAAAVG
jgi:hypothetical protein